MPTRSPIAIALALVALASAGCIGAADVGVGAGPDSDGADVRIVDAYPDADARVANSVGGTESSTKTVQVPLGTPRLVVKAAYVVDGTATFAVSDPVGMTKKQDDIAGSKDAWDEAWLVVENPLPGSWTFRVNVAGSAEYAFGFYY